MYNNITVRTDLINPHYMLNYKLYYKPYVEIIYYYFNGYIFEKDLKTVAGRMIGKNEYKNKRNIKMMIEENFLDIVKIQNMNLLKLKKNALIAIKRNKSQSDYKYPSMRQIVRSTLKANVIIGKYPVHRTINTFNKQSQYNYLVKDLYSDVYIQHIDVKEERIILSILDLKNYLIKDFIRLLDEIYHNYQFDKTIEVGREKANLKEFSIEINIYTYNESRKKIFDKYLNTSLEVRDYLNIRPRIKVIDVINLDISSNYFYGNEVLL